MTEQEAPVGVKMKPLLLLLENALWDFEANNAALPKFDDESFRAILKLFMTAIVERIWLLQEGEEMEGDDRVNMVTKAGNDIKDLIKVYTDIDTLTLYNNE